MEVGALVRWLTPAEGGKSEPPRDGSNYWGVAQLTREGVEETFGEHFSVGLT